VGRLCRFDLRDRVGDVQFVGLIPDLPLRDRSQSKPFQLSTVGLPWAGGDRRVTGTAMDGLPVAAGSPLVLSVHTIVSFDFAAGSFGLARDDLSAYRGRRDLCGLDCAVPDHTACEFTASRVSSPCATCNMAKVMLATG
jgi:hypothetical protein